ncbi:unnamed protein product [Rotaria sordida]|uniref:ADP ribosyltransferase domain-containing protein n=1 Tax=Rotaria sordida TaxID=392033 RepID=A0A814JG12_9BILA|nr:unnamed protein product [Rotaria sordida]CAF3751284.1 unnamed protein product [Rotaria sordida]
MALRTRTVDLLFLCRFFIRDISDRLTEKQCQHPVRVYRGQRMQIEERQRLQQSIGQLISVNSFLSTTLDRNVATQYLGDTKIQITDGDEEFVIFDIDADPKCRSKPFAIIEENSAIPEKQEVLFDAGSIFYLKSVHCEEQDDGYYPIWIMEMRLSNEEKHELPLSSFGLLLCNMKKYKFASKLF